MSVASEKDISASSPSLPSGTLTFLFTDVEGSTRLWEEYPIQMRADMVRHDALIEACVAQYGGVIVRPRGEGDSRFAVFPEPTDAIAAASAIQRAFLSEAWIVPAPLRVRMALHTGDADLRDGDYYGQAVNRCAKLRNAAYGGQTLISQATYNQVQHALPDGVSLRDMGEHRLKDLQQPERLYQLIITGIASEFPPLKTLESLHTNLPAPLTSFIGREKEMGEVMHLLAAQRLLTITGSGGVGKTRLAGGRRL
jgi:class 3 adenylate cyclase